VRNAGLMPGICLIALMSMANPLTAGQVRDEVRLGVALEAPQVGLHEPIYALFSVENRLDESIVADFGNENLNGMEKRSFAFSITGPDGRAIPIPPPPIYAEFFGNDARFVIKPQTTFTRRFLLNEWYEFPATGDYKVEVQSNVTFYSAAGRTIQPPEAPKTFLVRVGPRNETRLTRICSDLANQVVSAKNVEDLFQAIKTLSQVQDPVAVPYLRSVLEGNSPAILSYSVVPALGRIGNPEAADALISALSSKDADMRLMSVNILRKLEASTTDAKLKARIQDALR